MIMNKQKTNISYECFSAERIHLLTVTLNILGSLLLIPFVSQTYVDHHMIVN